MDLKEIITKAAIIHQTADELIDHLVRQYIDNAPKFQDGIRDPRFDKILSKYRELILLHSHNRSEKAAHELCRLACTGQSDADWTLEEIASFIKTWCLISDKIDEKITDLPNVNRGDDSYGDLLDSFPLVGEEIMVPVIKGVFKDFKDIEKAIKDRHGKEIAKFVLNGENYNRMMLTDKLKYFIIHDFVMKSKERGF